MILDIEKYPEFVPWCLKGTIHKKKDMSDIIEIEADLTVICLENDYFRIVSSAATREKDKFHINKYLNNSKNLN